jgi:GAF domain-containing protein
VSIVEGDVQLKQLRDIETKKNAAENLLRSAIFSSGTLEEALTEVCRIASGAMEVTRVNIWDFGDGLTSITSLVNYDNRFTELLPNATLYRYQIPKYFSLFETEEIIPTSDALNHPNTEELKVGYLDVHGIRSLMDVPVRIAGKMTGLVCFEDTKQIRDWNPGEKKFGLFIAQVIALAIESSRRKKTQSDLEQILDEKRILLNEIHRRVRNNFALIQDLLRAESGRAHDVYHKELFGDLRNRINSLDMLQRQLYQSEKVDRVNFRDLILDLVAGYRSTFSGSQTDFITTLDQCELNVAKASISGLFVNEIMMMLMSEVGRLKSKEQISIRLKKVNTRVNISIGSSINIDAQSERERMLTSFELAEKLGSKLEIDRSKGTGYSLSFDV